MSGRVVPLPKGGVVLVDELGALGIRTEPGGELGVLVELGGRLNKDTGRWRGQFVMSVGQAAELVANIVVGAKRTGAEFSASLEQALAAEQDRLDAIEAEHDERGRRA